MTYTPPTYKSWEVLKVGKQKFYWLAYRPAVEFSLYCGRGPAADSPEGEKQWLIAEGFASSREEARALSWAAAEQAFGHYDRYLFRRRQHYDGSDFIRRIYRRRHTRKRVLKPSTPTESRPEGALGYVWWDICSTWKKRPITKITAKRIWIAADPDTSCFRGNINYEYNSRNQQRSFDRAKLETDGHVRSWYTEAGKAAKEREREAYREQVRQEWREMHGDSRPFPWDADRNDGNGHFPLLALTSPFTRKDVLRAFRCLSLQLHPDQGGDPAQFRELVAEKQAALRQCSN